MKTRKRKKEKERSCTVCGHKETAVIKAAGKTEEPRKESDKTASVKTEENDPESSQKKDQIKGKQIRGPQRAKLRRTRTVAAE